MTWLARSMKSRTGSPRSPTPCSAKPNRIAANRQGGIAHRIPDRIIDAVDEAREEGVGDDVEDVVERRLRFAGLDELVDLAGVELARIDIHALAGADQVDHDQADQQRDRADHLEVGDRETAGFADRLHLLHARDADDDRAEDQRRDGRLDELDERITDGLELAAPLRHHDAEQHAERDRDQHAEIQRAVERQRRLRYHLASSTSRTSTTPSTRCTRSAMSPSSDSPDASPSLRAKFITRTRYENRLPSSCSR